MAGTADRAKQAGRSAIRSADSPWVKALGQSGVAAIGVVYLLLAYICVQICFGDSSEAADNSGAMQQISQAPFGRILLGAMALGLAAYAVWQAVEAIVGFQGFEDNKEKIFKRVSAGAKAVIGVALGFQAAKYALSGGGGSSSSQKEGDWTAKLLGAPAGQVLVVIAGLAVLGFAGYLAYEGVTKKFLEKVEGGEGRTVTVLGEIGFTARGVAFGILGVLIVVAGIKHQPDKAAGLDAALKTLAGQPYGVILLLLVAIGFAAYGVFQLVTCRSRREG